MVFTTVAWGVEDYSVVRDWQVSSWRFTRTLIVKYSHIAWFEVDFVTRVVTLVHCGLVAHMLAEDEEKEEIL